MRGALFLAACVSAEIEVIPSDTWGDLDDLRERYETMMQGVVTASATALQQEQPEPLRQEAQKTTAAPVLVAQSTLVSSTAAPATAAPVLVPETTIVSSTAAPVLVPETTVVSSTAAPATATAAPVSVAEGTVASSTAAPVADLPTKKTVTPASSTAAPVLVAQSALVPSTAAPVSDAPATTVSTASATNAQTKATNQEADFIATTPLPVTPTSSAQPSSGSACGGPCPKGQTCMVTFEGTGVCYAMPAEPAATEHKHQHKADKVATTPTSPAQTTADYVATTPLPVTPKSLCGGPCPDGQTCMVTFEGTGVCYAMPAVPAATTEVQTAAAQHAEPEATKHKHHHKADKVATTPTSPAAATTEVQTAAAQQAEPASTQTVTKHKHHHEADKVATAPTSPAAATNAQPTCGKNGPHCPEGQTCMMEESGVNPKGVCFAMPAASAATTKESAEPTSTQVHTAAEHKVEHIAPAVPHTETVSTQAPKATTHKKSKKLPKTPVTTPAAEAAASATSPPAAAQSSTAAPVLVPEVAPSSTAAPISSSSTAAPDAEISQYMPETASVVSKVKSDIEALKTLLYIFSVS